MDKTETAVLLSGGLDSSVALHWAHRNHRVRVALSFDYASQPRGTGAGMRRLAGRQPGHRAPRD